MALLRSLSFTLGFMLLISSLTSCDKNTSLAPANNTSTGSSLVKGLVFNDLGTPLVNVMVTTDGDTAYTDAKGAFKLSRATLGTGTIQIKAAKEGYFTTSTVAEAYNPSKGVNIHVQMTQRKLLAEFSATTGGRFSIGNNITITVAPNAYQDQDGNAYRGLVKLYAAALDAYDPNLSLAMPGGLRAIDPTNPSRTGVLRSAGALFLEEEPEGGRNSKTISVIRRQNGSVDFCKIVTDEERDFLSVAPITGWMLDNQSRWVPVPSQPTLSGNTVCFNLPAGSNAFNLDVLSLSGIVVGKVCNEDGFPVPYERVSAGQWSTVTDDDGYFRLRVPLNRPLALICSYFTKAIPALGPEYEATLYNIGSEQCTAIADLSGKFWMSYVEGAQQNNILGMDIKPTNDGSGRWYSDAEWDPDNRAFTMTSTSFVARNVYVSFRLFNLSQQNRYRRITADSVEASGSFMYRGTYYDNSFDGSVSGYVQVHSFTENAFGINAIRGSYYMVGRRLGTPTETPTIMSGSFGYDPI